MKSDMRIKKELEDFHKTVIYLLSAVVKIEHQGHTVPGGLSALERLHSWATRYCL